NVAWILASRGKRVLAVDWDLEAPGLHRYFIPFLVDRTLTSSDGIIDFVIDYTTEAMTPDPEGEPSPPDWYVPLAGLARYACSLEWSDWEFPDAGTLDFVCAGRQGQSYSARVNTFDWQGFYDRHGGGAFLEEVRKQVREEYDYILIDSRTGVSDTSGICAGQMPDALVVCFTLNNQSIDGAAAIARSVYAQRGAEFPIFPVPTRIEASEKEKLEARKDYARRKFALWPEHLEGVQREEYWRGVEMPYVPYYAYEEVLAVFGDKPISSTASLLSAMERLTSYLTRGEVENLVPAPEAVRQQVLLAYASRQVDEVGEEERSRAAEAVCAGMGPDEQTAVHRLFTSLLRAEADGTVGRARVPLQDVSDHKVLLSRFAGAGVIAVEEDPVTHEQLVQISDDGVLSHWKRLQGWIEEDREFLVWRQKLQVRMTEWDGRDEGALLTGSPLRSARAWQREREASLTGREQTYLQASFAASRKRTWRIAAVIVAMVSMAVAGVFGYQRLQLERQETAAFEAVLAADELFSQGDNEGALRRYQEAMALDPQLSIAYVGRARVLEEQYKDELALADYAKALELNPASLEAFIGRAEIFSRRGDEKRAIQTLEEAFKFWPRERQVLLGLAALSADSGEPERAIKLYDQMIDQGMRDDTTYFNRGLIFVELRDSKKAISDFLQVLKLSESERTRTAARAQLTKLGYTEIPADAAKETRASLYFVDQADAPVADMVAKELAGEGVVIDSLRRSPKAPHSGGIRFFFAEDRELAYQVLQRVGDSLAREGYPVDLVLQFEEKPPADARSGQVEVWLPALSKSARYIGKEVQGN
ncbi:MAG TPA: tetratricopeptide repeat protein, partial [Thermoanaerobaculia bacterium]|nr:tetratricopeptide repeat protein [Thermoanaerobaculia bacterium]